MSILYLLNTTTLFKTSQIRKGTAVEKSVEQNGRRLINENADSCDGRNVLQISNYRLRHFVCSIRPDADAAKVKTSIFSFRRGATFNNAGFIKPPFMIDEV